MPHPLRVIHVLRAPVGGLFRHVCDLAAGQSVRGIEVGIVCDAIAASPLTEEQLETIEHVCALGVHRFPMRRLPSLSDFGIAMAIRDRCEGLGANIVHGHGAKGGAYARLVARSIGAKAVYTPHGGSLHYSRASFAGALFLTVERMLLSRTDQFIFVCAFERDTFMKKVGRPQKGSNIIHNGVRTDELEPVEPAPDATDLLFVGELRQLKGCDLFIKAIAALADRPKLSACIVGSGPDEAAFKALVAKLGLADRVTFAGALPAREAFRRGRLLVVPSRAESLPYIVLEAMAAGVPLVASRVGGIPELLEGYEDLMVSPVEVDPLAAAIDDALVDLKQRQKTARRLTRRIATQFSVDKMVDQVTRVYLSLITQHNGAAARIVAHPYAAE